MRTLLPIVLLGCGSDAPRWAHDTLTLLPNGNAMEATQTWHLYTRAWQRRLDERHRVCVMVFDLQPEPIPACEGCTIAWSTLPVLVDSDCPVLLDTTFEALQRVGLDGSGSHMDVGFGWEPHGRPTEEGAQVWDGERPMVLASDAAWELTNTVTAVSDTVLRSDGSPP